MALEKKKKKTFKFYELVGLELYGYRYMDYNNVIHQLHNILLIENLKSSNNLVLLSEADS